MGWLCWTSSSLSPINNFVIKQFLFSIITLNLHIKKQNEKKSISIREHDFLCIFFFWVIAFRGYACKCWLLLSCTSNAKLYYNFATFFLLLAYFSVTFQHLFFTFSNLPSIRIAGRGPECCENISLCVQHPLCGCVNEMWAVQVGKRTVSCSKVYIPLSNIEIKCQNIF